MSDSRRLRAHRFRRTAERGQATAEYVVLLGVVGAMALAIASLLGASLRGLLQEAAQRMLSAVTGTPGA